MGSYLHLILDIVRGGCLLYDSSILTCWLSFLLKLESRCYVHLLLLQSGNRLFLLDFFSQGWRGASWDRKLLRLLLILSLTLGRLALTGLLFDTLAAEEVRVGRAVEVHADAARS